IVNFADRLWFWEDQLLPRKIAYSKILFSRQEDGLMEGCGFAVFQLSPDAVRAIEREKLGFFKQMPQPPVAQTDNAFGVWLPTPIPKVPYLLAYRAVNGCENDDAVEKNVGPIGNILWEDGAYYTVKENREGVIVVSPKRGIAVSMYFG